VGRKRDTDFLLSRPANVARGSL